MSHLCHKDRSRQAKDGEHKLKLVERIGQEVEPSRRLHLGQRDVQTSSGQDLRGRFEEGRDRIDVFDSENLKCVRSSWVSPPTR